MLTRKPGVSGINQEGMGDQHKGETKEVYQGGSGGRGPGHREEKSKGARGRRQMQEQGSKNPCLQALSPEPILGDGLRIVHLHGDSMSTRSPREASLHVTKLKIIKKIV